MTAESLAWNETEHAPSTDTGLLRVCTAGSVDDGKSTLIGRLLYDSKSLARDQLEHIQQASRRRGHARADLSLVTDGLRAEREQGITIDVAWRHFHTPRRRFVLADTPGHEQYTRNMVTGCSVADVAIVLVDARHGLRIQSRRHALLAALLGVRHVVVCANKMDLVGWDPARFAAIRDGLTEFLRGHPRVSVHAIPMSALSGENVVERGDSCAGYDGPGLLELLETLPVDRRARKTDLRLPIQWVIRPQGDGLEDYRGYAGRLASGTLERGEYVRVLPSGERARVVRIETSGRDVDRVEAGRSVIVHLDRDTDATRGDMLVPLDDASLHTGKRLAADLVWMHAAPSRVGGTYTLAHATRTVRTVLERVRSVLDVTTLESHESAELTVNGIGRVDLRASEALVWDEYDRIRGTGSLVLVDPVTGDTVAAGLLRAVPHD